MRRRPILFCVVHSGEMRYRLLRTEMWVWALRFLRKQTCYKWQCFPAGTDYIGRAARANRAIIEGDVSIGIPAAGAKPDEEQLIGSSGATQLTPGYWLP